MKKMMAMDKKEKEEKVMQCTTLNELLDVEYGEKGTAERAAFDAETEAFCLAETLREERLRAGLTQAQLAERVGTKKTYISRIENGRTDIQLSTLFRLFEGLGRKVSVAIL